MNFVRKHLLKITSGISISVGTCYYFKYHTSKWTYQEVKDSKRLLTTYENNVYDITDFVESHPGGKEKIIQAANTQLEPYWNLYKQHFKPEVFELLETMKVGELSDYDPEKFSYLKDEYYNEPKRSNLLKVHSSEPCNAETPTELIHKNPITPNDLWYVRNHNPVPDIKPEDYKLTFYHKKVPYKTLSLDDIKKMPSKKITTTIQCGGNRRGEFQGTNGTQWGIGAISTAEWEGVYLHNLLEYQSKHIHLIGFDGVKVSIPYEKGANPMEDVILAYKMNGEDLPRDHGYPLRIIVPGYVGVKNIKWIQDIVLDDNEIDSSWQTGLAYKVLPPSVTCLEDVSKINLSKIKTIEEMPIQSCITYIEKLKEHSSQEQNYRIHGYVYSSVPFKNPKVNVSVDNGESWSIASYHEFEKFKWGWCLWFIDVKIDEFPCEIQCKAIDNDGNTQPNEVKDIWNIRGLTNNSVHKRTIE